MLGKLFTAFALFLCAAALLLAASFMTENRTLKSENVQLSNEVDSLRTAVKLLSQTSAGHTPNTTPTSYQSSTQGSLERNSEVIVADEVDPTGFSESCPDPPTYSLSKIESKIIERVNEERKERSLKILILDENAQSAAKLHSADMATNNYFSHVSPQGKTAADRLIAFGIPFPSVGENIAKNYLYDHFEGTYGGTFCAHRYLTEEEIAEEAMRGWLASPSHRENLLSPTWDSMGVGVYIGDGGAVYLTQNFVDELTCGYKGAVCCSDSQYIYCYEPYTCSRGECVG